MNSLETVEEASEIDRATLNTWRQGDYTTDLSGMIFADDFDADGLLGQEIEVAGWVVISQTCDIVSYGAGREYVAVCPLKKAEPAFLREVIAARTPAAAILQNPPSEEYVADLNHIMSVHKRILCRVRRQDGFVQEDARSKFADALARKYGRFAFPDDFVSEILTPLRNKLRKGYGKDNNFGRSFRSVSSIRVLAGPHWDATSVAITFKVVLEPMHNRLASIETIGATIEEALSNAWPNKYVKSDPLFTLQTLDDMTAAEWVSSNPIDWDFISLAS
jgi:hypothetical protein